MASAETCVALEEMKNDKTIKEGDTVLLKKGKIVRIFQIRKKRLVWLDKLKFTLDGTVGHSYGSTFEVRDGMMKKISRDRVFREGEVLGPEKGTDNRDLHDLDSNQKLSRDDIEKMKKEGAKGQEIIDQLIENSVTFKAKTEYAQEKWVKKKKKKHVAEYTVLKPTTRLLCEMYHEKSPAKILHMRMDTLAQILTYGNIHAYTNVAVVDTCMGLVVGAVLERQGGYGKVIHFHPGDLPVRPAVDSYDFPSHFLDNLYSFPLHYVNSIKSQTVSQTDVDSQPKETIDSSKVVSSTEGSISGETESDKKLGNDSGEINDKKDNTGDSVQQEVKDAEQNSDQAEWSSEKKKDEIQKRRLEKESRRELQKLAKAKQMNAVRQLLQQHKIDCLIVACKFHPTPIVMALVEFVAPSRPVIVYSQYKEAVMDAYAYLREKTGLVNFRVSETWLREFQVMPMRTHPVIQMSAASGYLMTTTTVIPS